MKIYGSCNLKMWVIPNLIIKLYIWIIASNSSNPNYKLIKPKSKLYEPTLIEFSNQDKCLSPNCEFKCELIELWTR